MSQSQAGSSHGGFPGVIFRIMSSEPLAAGEVTAANPTPGSTLVSFGRVSTMLLAIRYPGNFGRL
jgi:hypothetical protein